MESLRTCYGGDEAWDQRVLDLCDYAVSLERAVARWEEFDFERDSPARLVERVLELMIERDKLKSGRDHVQAEWAGFLERAAAADARSEALARELGAAREALRILADNEYTDTELGMVCVVCQRDPERLRTGRHELDCWLAAALAAQEKDG